MYLIGRQLLLKVIKNITKMDGWKVLTIALFIWSALVVSSVLEYGVINRNGGENISQTLGRYFLCKREQDCLTIPKRIHQIWNDEVLPVQLAENVKGLARDNPRWEYVFWTKLSGMKLIQEKYPYLYQLALAPGKQEVFWTDILRYLVVHEYGGAYFDLDTVSVKPLDEFAGNHECSVALEPGEHYFSHRTDFLLTNAAFLCRAKHPFFKQILLKLATLDLKCRGAFQCTGPIMLTRLYRELNKTNGDVLKMPDVQPSEVFQDVYDHGAQIRRLNDNCQNYTKLQPYQINICENWIKRGKEHRTLSALALTYHTWFHVNVKKITLLDENRIDLLVPHVKIYGLNFG